MSLCVSFSRTGAGFCIYHLFVWLNLNFLHISQWITLPTQSFLTLYSICANLLHSLIIWMMVSSLSPHRLHLLYCCVLSILPLIWLVLPALFCAAVRRDSVSFLRLPFLCKTRFSCVRCCLLVVYNAHRDFFSSHFCFLVIVILLAIVLSVSFLMAVISLLSYVKNVLIIHLQFHKENSVFMSGKYISYKMIETQMLSPYFRVKTSFWMNLFFYCFITENFVKIH